MFGVEAHPSDGTVLASTKHSRKINHLPNELHVFFLERFQLHMVHSTWCTAHGAHKTYMCKVLQHQCLYFTSTSTPCLGGTCSSLMCGHVLLPCLPYMKYTLYTCTSGAYEVLNAHTYANIHVCIAVAFHICSTHYIHVHQELMKSSMLICMRTYMYA